MLQGVCLLLDRALSKDAIETFLQDVPLVLQVEESPRSTSLPRCNPGISLCFWHPHLASRRQEHPACSSSSQHPAPLLFLPRFFLETPHRSEIAMFRKHPDLAQKLMASDWLGDSKNETSISGMMVSIWFRKPSSFWNRNRKRMVCLVWKRWFVSVLAFHSSKQTNITQQHSFAASGSSRQTSSTGSPSCALLLASASLSASRCRCHQQDEQCAWLLQQTDGAASESKEVCRRQECFRSARSTNSTSQNAS